MRWDLGFDMVVLKSAQELARMRQAGRIVALVLAELEARVKPGITTGELDAIASKIIAQHHMTPSFLGYHGFPASVCVSVNEQVVHGIPGSRVLHEGDIVSIDVGAIYQGYHSDAATTLPVGKISPEAERLLNVTRTSLEMGIAQVRPDGRLWDVISAIQNYVEQHGYNLVRDYQGHGIGRDMHEDPSIPNFLSNNGPRPKNIRLKPGITLAIEPMVVAKSWKTRVLEDGWTVVTEDGALAAHFEHTVAVTPEGKEILTRL